MKLFITMTLFILSCSPVLAAVKVVECEDAAGERTFQTACPPGTTQVSSRQIRTGSDASAGTASGGTGITATLYVTPECDPCEAVREYLEARDVAVTVKDASYEQAIQEELKELTGILRVPVVLIGEKTITGYDRSELSTALSDAGYVEAE